LHLESSLFLSYPLFICFILILSDIQEIRSVERGYLSHCFKSRTRYLGHAPFGVIHRPLCSTCHGLSNKEKNEESTFIHLKVMESEVPKYKK